MTRKKDDRPEQDEHDLDPETVKDLDVQQDDADRIQGGSRSIPEVGKQTASVRAV